MLPLAQNGYSTEEVLAALQGRYGVRQLEFRFELLNSVNATVKVLANVLDAEVTHDSLADVKRTARFTIHDDGTINYLTARVKPIVRLFVPELPTPGAIQSATTYDEAVTEGAGALLARWRLDETAGTTAADASGNGRTLTYGAAATKGSAPLIEDQGRSVSLANVANSVVSTSEGAHYLNSLTSVSFAGWFKATGTGVAADVVATTNGSTHSDLLGRTHTELAGFTHAQLEADSSTHAELGTKTHEDLDSFTHAELAQEISGLRVKFVAATKNIQVTIYTSSNQVDALTPANTQTTDRLFVAFTWTSGGSLLLYLNGERVAQVASTSVVGALRGIRGLVLGGTGFAGQLDDVLFTGKVLTPSTVRGLYQVGAGVGPAAPPERSFVEFPQGVFLLSSPDRAADDQGVVTRQVTAYDQGVILQAHLTDQPYYVASGALYTDAIAELLGATPGIPAHRVTPSSKTVPAQMVWDAGTSHLRILGDLVAALNYEALWFDEHGVAVVAPYVEPQARPIEYDYLPDEVSVLTPGATQSLDLFKQPNKWVLVVSQPDRAVLTASYTNTDPASPTSTVNRGRTITDFRTEQDVADLVTLQAKVAQLAQEASQVFEQVEFITALMPMHTHRDVYRLAYPDLGVDDRFSETKWSYPLKSGAEMRHTARRVVQLAGVAS